MMADGSSCGWVTVARTAFVELPRESNRLRPEIRLSEAPDLLDRMSWENKRCHVKATRVAFETHRDLVRQMLAKTEGS